MGRKISRYNTGGFQLLTDVPASGLIWREAAAVKIEKGYAVHDDGTGYATDATVALSNAFLGIAVAECDNSAGSAGDKKVGIIPPLPGVKFAVPVAAAALVTKTSVGTYVDLEAAGTVDVSDTTIASGPGFFVEEIDVSAEAVAINAYGFVIGEFRYVS